VGGPSDPADDHYMTATAIVPKTSDPRAEARPARDPYVDVLRAASLLVVVAWHWAFTVIIWRPDGPHASNPIGTTTGLWLATWVLQVMPVFFVIGGFVHSTSWRGGSYAGFLKARLGRLLAPAAVAVVTVSTLGALASQIAGGLPWMPRAVILILSPLWFLAVYSGLVMAAPIAAWAHRRSGELALVVLAGSAVLLDIARLRMDWAPAAVLSWIVVWTFCHQVGFFWTRLLAAPRRFAWCLVLGGAFALVGLTNMGAYPRSMVGVPGETISNVGPPTACMVALCVLQTGLVVLLRERALRFIASGSPKRVVGWVTANSMPLYLWHGLGMAVAYVVVRSAGLDVPDTTSAAWWAQRPLWLIAPAVATLPLLRLSRRLSPR
jgi:fucose 4-O-acetylase-like acetyltransferase